LYRSSDRSWRHWYLCQWPSDSQFTWPGAGAETDEYDLFQGDFISYSQLMSQMNLDSGARTSGTQYDAPRASSYDTPVSSTWAAKTQAPVDARHERPRREIRPRDTYNPSLIRKMFRRCWCIFLEIVVYRCTLFSHLWFEI
jgi:hypothetical protein